MPSTKSKSEKGDSAAVGRGSVRSVERALDALELLAGSERPLGLGEIASRVGISAPAAHRLMSALRARGYVSQEAVTARYSAGLACYTLAALAASQRTLRRVAGPYLSELNEATGEAVHLAVHDSGWAVYIDKLEGRRETAPISRVGQRAPAHCVATGRALLAYLPEAELEVVIAGGLQRFTEATPADEASLRADLADVRRRGYAINRGAWRAGVGGVAAPIRDFCGLVQASVGCCLPLERLDERRLSELAAAVVHSAREISAQLGYVFPEAG